MNISKVLSVVKLTLPVATAYIPLGIALGVFMVSSGIHWIWAPISALVIFAGSIEFLVVTFILSGMPLAAIAWTTLIVNFRHIFYGLSFPLKSLDNPIKKLYGIFALTDETYGITCATSNNAIKGNSITLLQIISHFWWVASTCLGALIGGLIPSSITGFEFALTAMFVTLSVDAVRNNPNKRLIYYAITSSLIGFVFEHYFIKSTFLAVGLICYLGLISKDYKNLQEKEVAHGIRS